VPTHIDGVRSVVVNEALRELEPLAYHFVVNFAKDNDLQVVEACVLPDRPRTTRLSLIAAGHCQYPAPASCRPCRRSRQQLH
jgi:hypothetical protein